ncbi:MAG: hypothetical protein ISR76_09130, partial [Planctomycetes bacterium]|nr:hypothetical protein [Planctomycetota bacterium]
LPLPQGQLGALAPLEVWTGELALPADGQVLSRWEDGSIRWMRVEFVAPALAADAHFSGTLRLRSAAADPAGTLSVAATPGAPLTASTGALELEDALGAGELFRLRGTHTPLLSAAARFEVETADGLLLPFEPAGMQVERLGELSLVLRRIDQLVESDGHPSVRLTTRVTLHRGSGLVRLQQSLDVLRGVHEVRGWRLILPLDEPGSRTWAPLGEGRMSVRRGDAEVLQGSLDSFSFQGRARDGAFPGVVACGQLSVGLRHFSQLFPSGVARRGDHLVLDFCPGDAQQAEVLEDGFGRTVEVWLRSGKPRAAELHGFAAGLARPPLAHSTPDWYLAAEAFGQLGAALPGDHATLEERIAQSTDRVLLGRDRDPAHHYGIRHFGDFFDREHSISYFGSLQQEYDPGLVLLQQFLRTGDVDYLEPALDLAWHYADVDMTPYGGAFQHRATKHHVDAWVAGILAVDLEAEYQASPFRGNGLAGELAWVDAQWGAAAAETLDGWIAIERQRGLPEAALPGRLFRMIGFHLVGLMQDELPNASGATLEDYAKFLAQRPEAQARGYDDADDDFAAFFDRYGGSWGDFPSFHVDSSPVPEQRHQSGHSLIQGVSLAHLLSGEPRLRQRALAFGRHHVEELVPRAVQHLVRLRDTTDEGLYTRTVAWPIVNLETLVDLSCGMPGEQLLRGEMLAAIQDCAGTLLAVPIDRIRSSIHAGITLEGLAQHHQRTGDAAVADYLKQLARRWARDQYDWSEHAFRYRASGPTEAYHGMSGLLVYGLAYAEQLEHDEELWSVLQDAWNHLPQATGYAKSFAMLYRGAPRALHLMRLLGSVTP